MNNVKIRKTVKRAISMILVAVLLVLSLPNQFLQIYATTKSQWEIKDPPSENMLTGTFGNDTFLILDYNGKIYGSGDGEKWEEYAQIDLSKYDVSGAELSYRGEYFYIYGNQGLFLYSKDGKIWNSLDMGSYQIVNVAQSQGKYYAVSEIRIVYSGDIDLIKDTKLLFSENGCEWQEFDSEIETERYIDVQCGKDDLMVSAYDAQKGAVVIYSLDSQGKIKNSQELATAEAPQKMDGRMYYVDDCFVTFAEEKAYCLKETGAWQESPELTDKLCGYYGNALFLDPYIVILYYNEIYTCFAVKEEPGKWYLESNPLNYANGFLYGNGKAVIFSSDSIAVKIWNAVENTDKYSPAQLAGKQLAEMVRLAPTNQAAMKPFHPN